MLSFFSAVTVVVALFFSCYRSFPLRLLLRHRSSRAVAPLCLDRRRGTILLALLFLPVTQAVVVWFSCDVVLLGCDSCSCFMLSSCGGAHFECHGMAIA